MPAIFHYLLRSFAFSKYYFIYKLVDGQSRFFYRFDPAHKLDKVHLHKYKHLGGNKYKLIEEVDPETGNTIRYVNGDIEIWG